MLRLLFSALLARVISDVDPSTARLKAEIGALRRRGATPQHWFYRMWQPSIDVAGGVKFTDEGAAIFPGRISVGKKLVHPQDQPYLSPYYRARFEPGLATLIKPSQETRPC